MYQRLDFNKLRLKLSAITPTSLEFVEKDTNEIVLMYKQHHMQEITVGSPISRTCFIFRDIHLERKNNLWAWRIIGYDNFLNIGVGTKF